MNKPKGGPTANLKQAGTKRERPSVAKSTQRLSVDVPGLFFGALVVVFVLWPAAQWAFGL